MVAIYEFSNVNRTWGQIVNLLRKIGTRIGIKKSRWESKYGKCIFPSDVLARKFLHSNRKFRLIFAIDKKYKGNTNVITLLA